MKLNNTFSNRNRGNIRNIDDLDPLYIKMDLNVDILNKIILMIFIEDNPNINNKCLLRIKKLFDMIHRDSYKNVYQLSIRCFVIKNLLEKLFIDRIEDRNILADSIKDGKYREDIELLFEDLNDKMEELTDGDVWDVNYYISDRLQYCHLREHAEKLNNLTMDILSNNYETLKSLNDSVEAEIEALYGKIRKSKTESSLESLNFGSNSEDLDFITNYVLDYLKNPAQTIKTGSKRLNEMTCGGFEKGRVYCFIGVKKGFKSGLLLNLADAAKRYNPDILTSVKKPLIIYLSQENDNIDTFIRLAMLYTGLNKEQLKKLTKKEVTRLMVDNGYLEGIELKIIYKDNNSISTMDLIPIIEDYERCGYTVVALFHDYLKRIRSSENIQDIRIRFGEIVNEFSVIAKNKKLPIITAMQINREGQKVLEELVSKKEMNIGRKLEGTHIGESSLILENVDAAYIINKEYVESIDKQFVTFKPIAVRFEITCDYFAQEFESSNKFKLKLDQHLPDGKYHSCLDISDNLISSATLQSLNPDENISSILNSHLNKPILKASKADFMDDF